MVNIGDLIEHGETKGFVVEVNGDFAKVICKKPWGLDFATVRRDRCDYSGITSTELKDYFERKE